MKKIFRNKLILFEILFLICLKAFPCDCATSTFDRDLANTDYIISGRIISKEDNIIWKGDNYDSLINGHIVHFFPSVTWIGYKYKVVIKEIWKGERKDTIYLCGNFCDFDFLVNETYLIWAYVSLNKDEFGFLSASICSRTRLLDNSPDIDLLNYKIKGLNYDSTYLTKNEIKVLKKMINADSLDLSKTVLFISDYTLLSKMKLIDAIFDYKKIEYINFPQDKIKLLPDKAISGALIVKDYEGQKIDMDKIIKLITMPPSQ